VQQTCVADVYGVTQLGDVIYTVCPFNLSDEQSAIWQFSATTHKQLTDIDAMFLGWSRDIASCEQSSQLYVADYVGHVWQVSATNPGRQNPLPRQPTDTFKPWTLSVTSSRLLVTSRETKELRRLRFISCLIYCLFKNAVK